MNIDKEKFVNYMFNTSSYKEVNSLVLALTTESAVEKVVNEWINNVQNIKKLCFVERISDYTTSINFEKMQEFIGKVEKGEKITLEQWQTNTNGKCLLIANGQVFATTPIAVQMVIDWGGEEILGILSPSIENIYQNIKNTYEGYFQNALDKVDNLVKYYCIYDLAFLYDCWYQYVYAHTAQKNVLFDRANYIKSCLDILR